jgi:hypothetical protein
MDWQMNLKTLTSDPNIDQAGIYDLITGEEYAASTGFTVNDAEFQEINLVYDDLELAQGRSIKINNIKYSITRGDPYCLVCCSDSGHGVTIYRSAHVIVVGTYNKDMSGQDSSIAVINFAKTRLN